jgi:hypothetical protein
MNGQSSVSLFAITVSGIMSGPATVFCAPNALMSSPALTNLSLSKLPNINFS